jgi:hypothetical protein
MPARAAVGMTGLTRFSPRRPSQNIECGALALSNMSSELQRANIYGLRSQRVSGNKKQCLSAVISVGRTSRMWRYVQS